MFSGVDLDEVESSLGARDEEVGLRTGDGDSPDGMRGQLTGLAVDLENFPTDLLRDLRRGRDDFA